MRSHTDALEAFLQLLVSMPEPGTIATAIAGGPLRALSPVTVTVHLLTEGTASDDTRSLRLVSHYGLGAGVLRTQQRLGLSEQQPVCIAAATSATVRGNLAQLAGTHPLLHLFAAEHPQPAEHVLLAVPLRLRGAPSGVLAVTCAETVADTWDAATEVAATALTLTLWAAAETATAGAGPDLGARAQVAITDRKRRVIALIREGLTNAEIARALGFSVGTVKADITALSAALGAHGREDLARRAERAGL